MKTRYKIYTFLSFVYCCLAIGYLYFLANFDCDGLGCLSIICVTGPIAIGFAISFLWMLATTFRLTQKQLNDSQFNQKMDAVMALAGIPFWLFTSILIFIAAGYLS